MLDFEEPFKQSLRMDKRMIETIIRTKIEKIKLITIFVTYCYCRFIGLKNYSAVYMQFVRELHQRIEAYYGAVVNTGKAIR